MTGGNIPSPGVSGDLVPSGPDLARRIARTALQHAGGGGPAALAAALEQALAAEDAGGDGAGRARAARDVALLHDLLGDAGPDPVDGLARHVAFVLAAPAGNPLWADLRRLRELLDDLGRTLRRQRRTARVRRSLAAQARGTEQVMARSMAAFAETWRRPG